MKRHFYVYILYRYNKHQGTHEFPFVELYPILIICALLQSRRENQSLALIYLSISIILERAIYTVKGREHKLSTDFSVR